MQWGGALYRSGVREGRLRELPVLQQAIVDLLRRELDALVDLQRETEKAMLGESRRDPMARIVATAPGLGSIRVAQPGRSRLASARICTSVAVPLALDPRIGHRPPDSVALRILSRPSTRSDPPSLIGDCDAGIPGCSRPPATNPKISS